MKKRTFRSLSGSKVYRKWSDWEIGDYVVGKYESQEIDNYKKPCYVLKIEEIHFQDTEAAEKFKVGEQLGLNHNGLLAKVMDGDNVDIGDIVRIEYQGTNIMTKGNHSGKEAHSLLIGVAEAGDSFESGGDLSDDDSYEDDDTF